jgi:hypothetical protein
MATIVRYLVAIALLADNRVEGNLGRRDISTMAEFEAIVDDEIAWVLYVKSNDEHCGAFEESYQRLVGSLQRIHAAVINVDTSSDGKAIAELLGAVDEGLPNLKLLVHSNAALPVMTGNRPRNVKRIRKEMKRNLLQLRKNKQGFFLKSTGTPPSDFIFDLATSTSDEDDTICYEVDKKWGTSTMCAANAVITFVYFLLSIIQAKWCSSNPGLPKNCGSWTR